MVVTRDELLPWYSLENLDKALQRQKDKPYGMKRVQLGGNGRQLLISYDSLPAQIKEALPDPRKVNHILERYYKVDGEAVRYYSTYQFADGSYLDADVQEKYITNASVLKAIIALREARTRERKSRGGSLTGIMLSLCSDAAGFQQVLKVKHGVEHTLPGSEKHFKKALNAFETANGYNYESLISGKHGNSNSRKVTDPVLKLLNNMFATDSAKPTATIVHSQYSAFISGYVEVIDNETGEVISPAGFKKLSATTVNRYLAQWENKIGTWALRSGNRQQYMQQFKPYHKLSKPEYAGSIISIDDRQPPFKSLDGKRVWFYNGIDLGSEAFVCCVHGRDKEGIIIEFYRELLRNYHVWNLHLPAELEAEMSLNSSFVNTFLREGAMFEHVRIEANNARGKRIERYFRTLRYEYEKDREGWLARPFALSESNQAGSHEVKALPYETIVDGCLDDVDRWNSQKHSVHTHLTRWEVFMQMQNPDLKPTNYPAIFPHLGYRTVTSCRVGQLRLQNNDYLLGIDGRVALGEQLIGLMRKVEGQDVQVYWLDDHEGKVFKALIFQDNHYICEAVLKPEYNRSTKEQTPADREAWQLMSSYVATIEAFGRQQRSSIEPVTLIRSQPAQAPLTTMPRRMSTKPLTAAAWMEDYQPPMIAGAVEDTDEQLDYVPATTFTKSLKDRF
jgi:hypothetical protein